MYVIILFLPSGTKVLKQIHGQSDFLFFVLFVQSVKEIEPQSGFFVPMLEVRGNLYKSEHFYFIK